VRIEWHGEALELRRERALHWPRERTLFIADPHFGKAASFRALGVPVPPGTTRTDTERLSALLQATAAARLIVLGDFFHSAAGRAPRTMERIGSWRASHASLEIMLVPGNHDRGAGAPPEAWGIRRLEPGHCLGGFALHHEPPERAGPLPALAGHLHPVVRLEEAGGAGVRAPCFIFGKALGLLPAFGSFTGGARVEPRAGDRVFAAGPDGVVEIPGRPAFGRRRSG
jgi:uncharacterized protein